MAESCTRIVDGLRDRGVKLTLVHLTGRPGLDRLEPAATGHTLLFSRDAEPAHTLLRLWERLERLHARTPFTHAVAFGGYLPLLGLPTFAAGWHIPLFVLLRGNDFDTGLFDPVKRPMLLEALTRAHRVAVVSQDKARRIRALLPELDPVWIPNGIDLDSFQPLPSDVAHAQEWRQRMGEPQNAGVFRHVLGFFGHLKAKKGGELLLTALKRGQLGSRFHLLIIGELQEGLDAELEQLEGLTFTRLPFQNRYQLMQWYLCCELLALPSYYDGFPNVLAESLALGVPVLASNTGGMADILTEGETGFLFEPGDVSGCIAALHRIVHQSPEHRQQMSANCRRLAETALPLSLELARYQQWLGLVHE